MENQKSRPHLVDGEFQSDKYPWAQRGFVPLKVTDKAAQPLLWAYAEKHRAIDAGFAEDLQAALRFAGYEAPAPAPPAVEAKALLLLFRLAYAAYFAMDDSEQLQDESHKIDHANALKICAALDRLQSLPDDQPGSGPRQQLAPSSAPASAPTAAIAGAPATACRPARASRPAEGHATAPATTITRTPMASTDATDGDIAMLLRMEEKTAPTDSTMVRSGLLVAILTELQERRARGAAIPDDQIAELRALLEKATSGPWKRTDTMGCKEIRGDKSGHWKQAQYRGIASTHGLSDEAEDAANADLMVTARNQLPALLSLLESQRETWQPIETAPKDSTLILLHVPTREYDGPQQVGCFLPPVEEGDKGGWWIADGRYQDHPTHWRPLLSPPDAEDASPEQGKALEEMRANTKIADRIRKVLNGYPYGDGNPWPLDLLWEAVAALESQRQEGERMRAERDGERQARENCERALRGKDEAMGILFKRLQLAGVDVSDLLP